MLDSWSIYLHVVYLDVAFKPLCYVMYLGLINKLEPFFYLKNDKCLTTIYKDYQLVAIDEINIYIAAS